MKTSKFAMNINLKELVDFVIRFPKTSEVF